MRTVILGSQGQLGRDLLPRVPGEVFPWTRADFDLGKPESLAEQLAAIRPDLVINCAAYNLVDKAETEPDTAWRVNAIGVRDLAKVAYMIGARFVHFSTDYVFGSDVDRSEPWNESDAPGPVSVYGASKFAGENLAFAEYPGSLVIRTCGLYGVWGSGGKGGNFIETMLKLGGQNKPLRVVDDQHCTPTSTADLADATVQLLNQQATGLFHLTNAGATTWHNLAAEVFRQSELKVDLTPITAAEFGAAAHRPAYSVLNCSKAAALGAILPDWHDAVERYLVARRERRL